MNEEETLKKELKALQDKREKDLRIKRLKKQIKLEKFSQTKSGKVFNKIADIGDAGFKATRKFLSAPPQPTGSKKKQRKVMSVEEVMARLPQ